MAVLYLKKQNNVETFLCVDTRAIHKSFFALILARKRAF